MDKCELEGFDGIKCGGRLEWHHIINRAKLKNKTSARIYCENTHPEIFLTQVCSFHNTVTKIADCKRARRRLLLQKVELFGEEYVRSVVDSIPWKVPSAHYDLTFEAIMGAE